MAAAVPIVSIIYLFFDVGPDIFKALAIGAYLTLFAAAGMIYVSVGDQIINKIRGQKKHEIAVQDPATTHAKGKEVLDVKSV